MKKSPAIKTFWKNYGDIIIEYTRTAYRTIYCRGGHKINGKRPRPDRG